MRNLARTGLLTAVLLTPSPAPAQNIIKDLGKDFRNGVHDVLSVWAAPFRASGRDWTIGAAHLGGVGLSALADENVAQWIRDHPDADVLNALKPFREGHPYSIVNAGSGNWYPKGALAIYGIGLVVRNRAIRDVGMGCEVTHQSQSVWRNLVYLGVSRERPLFRDTVGGELIERAGRPYHIEFPGDKSNWFDNSFFGGHNANVVGCVSFINSRFHLSYAEPVLWAFAAAFSAGRMADQRHYTSDILLGALVGGAAGKIVGDRSRARVVKRPSDSTIAIPDSARHSWKDGLYVTRSGSATLMGWRTPPR